MKKFWFCHPFTIFSESWFWEPSQLPFSLREFRKNKQDNICKLLINAQHTMGTQLNVVLVVLCCLLWALFRVLRLSGFHHFTVKFYHHTQDLTIIKTKPTSSRKGIHSRSQRDEGCSRREGYFLWSCDLWGENGFSDSMQMPQKDTAIFYSAEGWANCSFSSPNSIVTITVTVIGWQWQPRMERERAFRRKTIRIRPQEGSQKNAEPRGHRQNCRVS